jgi:hypothetical protein
VPRYRFVDPEIYHSLSGLPAQRLAARRRALWPTICAGVCLLGLLGFHHFQPEQETTATTYLMVLVASFFGGSFLGVIGGMD